MNRGGSRSDSPSAEVKDKNTPRENKTGKATSPAPERESRRREPPGSRRPAEHQERERERPRSPDSREASHGSARHSLLRERRAEHSSRSWSHSRSGSEESDCQRDRVRSGKWRNREDRSDIVRSRRADKSRESKRSPPRRSSRDQGSGRESRDRRERRRNLDREREGFSDPKRARRDGDEGHEHRDKRESLDRRAGAEKSVDKRYSSSFSPAASPDRRRRDERVRIRRDAPSVDAETGESWDGDVAGSPERLDPLRVLREPNVNSVTEAADKASGQPLQKKKGCLVVEKVKRDEVGEEEGDWANRKRGVQKRSRRNSKTKKRRVDE
jgi:hypothetical protein